MMIWGCLDDNKQVIPCSMSEWQASYKCHRHVGANNVRGLFFVSTVFLGIDYGFGGRPQWFETMVFVNRTDESVYVMRYETYEQALAGHARTIEDGLHRRGWARWLGYSQSHLRKIQRGLHV